MSQDFPNGGDTPVIPSDAHEPPAHPHIVPDMSVPEITAHSSVPQTPPHESTETHDPEVTHNKSPELHQVVTSPIQEDPTPHVAPVIDLPKDEPIDTPPVKRSKRGLMVAVFVVFLIFFLSVGGASAALIAYDKVVLPSKAAQDAIRTAVQSLPFAPKSPRYILERTALAHANTTSVGIDASLAISSQSLLSVTGSSDLDFSMVGTVDYHDKKNIESVFNVQAGKLFAADIKYGNSKTFVKLITIPEKLITAAVGFPEGTLQPLLSGWMLYESNKLDTEARKELDANNESVGNKVTDSTMKLLSDDVLMKKFEVTETDLDGERVYKIKPTLDEEFVTHYVATFGSENDKQNFDAKKITESLSDLSFEAYLGKSDFLVRKLSLSVKLTRQDSLLDPIASYIPTSGGSDVSFTGVIKFKDFGKDFPFEEPANARKVEDVFAELMMNIQNTATESAGIGSTLLAVNPSKQFQQARDTQRRADLFAITNAIYQYAAEHNGNLPHVDKGTSFTDFPSKPTCVGTGTGCFDLTAAIIPTYIAAMPKDPSTGTEANTGYMVSRDENGRLRASAVGETTAVIQVTR